VCTVADLSSVVPNLMQIGLKLTALENIITLSHSVIAESEDALHRKWITHDR